MVGLFFILVQPTLLYVKILAIKIYLDMKVITL